MDREWTDKRMDDFAGRVDRFEANVERRFDRLEAKLDRQSARSDAKMDWMNRTIWGGIIAAAAVKFFFG